MNLLVLIFLGIQSISLLLIAMTAFTACSIYKKQVKNNKNDIEKPNKDDQAIIYLIDRYLINYIKT